MADDNPTSDVSTASEIDDVKSLDKTQDELFTADGSEYDGESPMDKIFELAASALNAVALFTSICTEDQHRDSYDRTMPLLKKTLLQSTHHSKALFYVSFKAITRVAFDVGKDRFVPDFDEVSKALCDILPTVAVSDESFLPLVNRAIPLCDLMGGDSQRLVSGLSDAGLRALRTPFEDFANNQVNRILVAKERACTLISRWTRQGKEISLLDAFAPRAEEISVALIDYLESADSATFPELTELAVAALPVLQTCLSRGAAPVAARRALWKSHWRYFKNGIKLDERLRPLYVQILSPCLTALGSEALAVDDLEELTLMMKEQMEEEMRRRALQMAPQFTVLHLLVNMVWELGKMRMGLVGYYLRPLMPLVFPLVAVSPLKSWAVWLVNYIIIDAPDYALFRYDDIFPLLVSSLSSDEPESRFQAAHSFSYCMLRDNSEWRSTAVKCLEALEDLIDRPDARLPMYAQSTEVAIASIGAILNECEVGPLKFQRLLSRLLHWLPFTMVSTPVTNLTYHFLADIFEKRKLILMCEPDAHDARLLEVLIKALHFNIFPSAYGGPIAKERLTKIIRSMAEEDGFTEWAERADLNEEQWKTLERITSDFDLQTARSQ